MATSARLPREVRLKSRRPGSRVPGLLLLLLLVPGCIERKMVLRSEPPGAVAYVDDARVGPTPCETSFSHYGTRRVILEKDGFRRVDADAVLSPPWYQYPIFDLVTEVLVPFTIEDRQEFRYALEPAGPLPEREEILERAHELRERMERENAEEKSQIPNPKSQ